MSKILDGISNPRLRKPLMILAPCLALVLAGLVLIPRLGAGEQAGPEAAPVSVQTEEPAPQDALPEAAPEPPQVETAVVEEPAEPEFGWKTVEGKRFYLNEDGSYAVGLTEIDGKLYYFDQNGVRAKTLGIDVSFYNGTIDWRAVKEQGIGFAIIRVGCRGWTSGVIYIDPRAQEYLRGARAAGIPIGVYFYSTAVNTREAVEEAEMTLRAVDGIPLDCPIFIDMEMSGEYPRGRSDRLSPSERAEIVIAFCETVRNSGYQPGVYGGQNYMKRSIDYHSISGYTVWLASYTARNKLPNFSNRYDIWQFSDVGKVNGIEGDVDMNVIFYEN